MKFVADPANPARNLPEDVELHPPHPVTELEAPRYPAGALAAVAGTAIVGIRLVVGVDGTVTSMTRSPVVPSTVGPFEGEFRAAAEAAVGGWMFQPAWLAKFGDGPDGDGDGKPDYRVATSIERVGVYLDVRIEFEIVEGEGKVRVSGLPEKR